MDFFNDDCRADVVLLDYCYTLVENHGMFSREHLKNYPGWIAQETYRQWLIGILAGTKVVLITARRLRYRDVTLSRVSEEGRGLTLEMSLFNEGDYPPPDWKKIALDKYVFPKYGKPSECAYLALESNPRTRAMYARNGIRALRVPEVPPYWDSLPLTRKSLQ